MIQVYSWNQGALDRLLAMRRNLPHALILYGPSGIGKSALAERFANALLCESPTPAGDACGQCSACGWFAHGNHPDLRRLAPLSESDDGKEKGSRDIRIDQVRALAEFLSVGGHRGARRVVLIDPADRLNMPAANALLKTLEEPAGDAVFLLVSARPDGLPATIRSRCVRVEVPLPPRAAVARWLQDETGAGEADIASCLAMAGGRPLHARLLAEPAQAAAHRLLVQAVARIPENPAVQVADAIAAIPAASWLPVMQYWVNDVARVAAGADAVRFPDQRERLAAIAARARADRLTGFAAWLQRQTAAVDHPLNPRLFCEDLLLRYSAVFD